MPDEKRPKPRLEIGHVRFPDIVGYAKPSILFWEPIYNDACFPTTAHHETAPRTLTRKRPWLRATFFSELKRRNVFPGRRGLCPSAWLLVQVATQVFPFFQIANWLVRWVVVAAAIGFRFWVLFGWFYQWTPQGLQRETEEAAPLPPEERQSRRNVDRWIMAILAMAVVLLLTDKFILRERAGQVAAKPVKSIAVLPF